MDPAQTRQERKLRTRAAIVDAALDLLEDESFDALSLRQITRRVGIVPTAFYRHFGSLDELGLALVEESFASLRSMLRRPREETSEGGGVIAATVQILVTHVHQHRRHFGFVVRERSGGNAAVRLAVGHQLDLFEREVATDLARLPVLSVWSNDDLYTLARLMVVAMVATAERIVHLPPGRPELEREAVRDAERQLRLIVVGVQGWRSR